MPAKPIKPKKSSEDLAKPSSVSRPLKLAKRFNEFLLDASSEIGHPVGHSEAVCALEELAMDNPTVHNLLMKKLMEAAKA